MGRGELPGPTVADGWGGTNTKGPPPVAFAERHPVVGCVYLANTDARSTDGARLSGERVERSRLPATIDEDHGIDTVECVDQLADQPPRLGWLEQVRHAAGTDADIGVSSSWMTRRA